MKRRSFIKSLGLMGSSILVPSMMNGQGVISSAAASNLSSRNLIGARQMIGDEIDFVKPSVLPKVINIFLYGGPSELGGNLTNIDEINASSKNKYPASFLPGGTQHTANGFWLDAGGREMERMLGKKRLSIYRSIHRDKDNSRAHRPSIFSNLTGMIGEDNSRPGIATNIAAILAAKEVINEDAIFPFATFEGESVVFNQGSGLSLSYKPISLNSNLENPYQRRPSAIGDMDAVLEVLAQSSASTDAARYQKVTSGFSKRGEIDGFIGDLSEKISAPTITYRNPDFVDGSDVASETNEFITYPGGNFGPKLKAAVELMIYNPDTLFVSLGSGGLGGWDDHNAALSDNNYPSRMRNLMQSLEVAGQHLEAAGMGNVVINVFGDFGRNANLNDSGGWDHGNCQNLYTVGAGPSAAGLPGRELGKIVGETEVSGNANQNRLYTQPTSNSYTTAPFAIAASVYQYFGIQNPEVLTGGYEAIDETGSENLFIG